MPAPRKVFLSHTREFRAQPPAFSFMDAAERAVNRSHDALFDMEYFASRDESPASVCRAQVEKADLYVGIIGFRYGSLVPGEGVSYTELEFRTATGLGIPRLMFLLDEKASVPLGEFVDHATWERQARFRASIEGEAGITVRWFSDAAQLETLIYQALTESKETATSDPDLLSLAASASQDALRAPRWLQRGDAASFIDPAFVLRSWNLRMPSSQHAEDKPAVDQLIQLLVSSGVVTLTGSAGVGKSTLLQSIARECTSRGFPAFVIDASKVSSVRALHPEITARECLLTAAAAQLGLSEDLRRSFILEGRSAAIAFLIDQAEGLAESDLTWLAAGEWEPATDAHGFLRKAPRRFGLLIASRHEISLRDAEAQPTKVEVQALSRAATLELARWASDAIGAPPTDVVRVLEPLLQDRTTAQILGHPLFLLFAIKTHEVTPSTNFTRDRLTREVVSTLLKQARPSSAADRLGAELTNLELRALGRAATVSDGAAASQWIENIHRALGPAESVESARAVLRMLVLSGLVHESEEGIAFTHAVFREHFIALWLAPVLTDNPEDEVLRQLVLDRQRRQSLTTAFAYLLDDGNTAAVAAALVRLNELRTNDTLFGLLQYQLPLVADLIERGGELPLEIRECFEGLILQFLEAAWPQFHFHLIAAVAEQLSRTLEKNAIIERWKAQASPRFKANALTFVRFCEDDSRRLEFLPLAQEALNNSDPDLRYAASFYLGESDGLGDLPEDIPESRLAFADRIESLEESACREDGTDAVTALISLTASTKSSLFLQRRCISALVHSSLHQVANEEAIAAAVCSLGLLSKDIGRRLRDVPNTRRLAQCWIDTLAQRRDTSAEHILGSWLSETFSASEIFDMISERAGLSAHFLEVLVEAAVDTIPEGTTPDQAVLTWTSGGHPTELRASVLVRLSALKLDPSAQPLVERCLQSTSERVAIAARLVTHAQGWTIEPADREFRRSSRSRDEMVRMRAAHLLPWVSEGFMTAAINSLNNDPSAMVRASMASALSRLCGSEASTVGQAALVAMLRDKSDLVQVPAFSGLVRSVAITDASRRAAFEWLIGGLESGRLGNRSNGWVLQYFAGACASADEFARVVVTAATSQSEYVHAGMGSPTTESLARTRVRPSALADALRTALLGINFSVVPHNAGWLAALGERLLVSDSWPESAH